mmetsp:Transcript_11457/g.19383  ORF Transcript_11457/g.19383 Transcript_11457/m.19383 type:complete len:173 (+) Transcript_11457:2793-3311(+)
MINSGQSLDWVVEQLCQGNKIKSGSYVFPSLTKENSIRNRSSPSPIRASRQSPVRQRSSNKLESQQTLSPRPKAEQLQPRHQPEADHPFSNQQAVSINFQHASRLQQQEQNASQLQQQEEHSSRLQQQEQASSPTDRQLLQSHNNSAVDILVPNGPSPFPKVQQPTLLSQNV